MGWRGIILGAAHCLLASALVAETDYELPRADGALTPIREFAAHDGGACPDLMILSHGFGGSRRGLNTYAKDAAAQGFRVLVMEHAESGRAVGRAVRQSDDPRQALRDAVADGVANRKRHLDLDAAYAHATKDCAPRLMVLGGHSMGAQTAMIEAGARNLVGVEGKDRFDAYVMLSPQGSGGRFPPNAWGGVTKPALLVTGTRDGGTGGDYTWRLEAFEGLPEGHVILAVVVRGSHRDMGGRPASRAARSARAVVTDFLSDLRAGREPDIEKRLGVTIRRK